MVPIRSRQRSLFVLAGVVSLQVLLLAIQIRTVESADGSRSRLIRVWSVSAVSPFERSGAWGIGRIRDALRHYFALSDTARENEALRPENGHLKMDVTQLHIKSAEAYPLAALINFKQQ